MASILEVLKQDIAHKSDYLLAPNGDLDLISGLANIKEALFRRLITTPGSLAHRPTYGVGIKSFQNSLNSLENQRTLAARIKEQFELDSRVEAVSGVRVDYGDNTPEKLTIIVRVKIKGYDELEADFIPFGEGV
jgi:hypothetical protein